MSQQVGALDLESLDINPLYAKYSVIFDWRAYFEDFDSMHGGEPVEFDGKLLYSDGWRYSKSDYAGPEYEPPSDPEKKKRLILAYYRIRLGMVKGEYKYLLKRLDALIDFQDHKSLPIQQKSSYWNPDVGKRVSDTHPLDLKFVESRIDWCRRDIRDCERVINSIMGPSNGKR